MQKVKVARASRGVRKRSDTARRDDHHGRDDHPWKLHSFLAGGTRNSKLLKASMSVRMTSGDKGDACGSRKGSEGGAEGDENPN